MKNIGPIAVAFWMFLLPTLCLAGVFTHACVDCSDEETCAHEEDCFADPCADVGVPPSGVTLQSIGPVAPGLGVTPLLATTIELPAPGTWALPPCRPPDRLLPIHASDLPLLI